MERREIGDICEAGPLPEVGAKKFGGHASKDSKDHASIRLSCFG